MKKRIIALLCLLAMAVCLVATGCQGKVVAYDRGTPLHVSKVSWRGIDEEEMLISCYIGPQDFYAAIGYALPSLITDESYAKLAECGINAIVEQRMRFDSEEGMRAVELAGKHGITYYMGDTGVMSTDVTDPNAAVIGTVEEVAARMQELMQHDGFGGFYLRDEPTSNLFPMLTHAVEVLEQAREIAGDTSIQGNLNAFPRVGWNQLSAGTDETMTWEKYLTGMCETGVDYLSWDGYPFTNVPGEVQAGYLNGLGLTSEYAKKYDIPLMFWMQCGGGPAMFSSSHRVVNEDELYYNVGSALCFGAKAIAYYTGVTPPEAALMGEDVVNDDSLLNKYGSKTPFWYYAKNINDQVKAIDHVLLNAAHEGVIIDDDGPNIYTGSLRMDSYRCFKGFSGDSALIGCFDYEGTVALLVMNNSIENHHAVITLKFDNNYEYEVTQRAITDTISGKEFSLHLEAGEFALVVVQ